MKRFLLILVLFLCCASLRVISQGGGQAGLETLASSCGVKDGPCDPDMYP
jgi:hypothetical protein